MRRVTVVGEEPRSESTPTSSASDTRRAARHPIWAERIPDEEWAVYQSAVTVLRGTKRPFLLAGAFGLAT